MHANSKLLFEKYALKMFRRGMKVLEVGPELPSVFQSLTADLSLEWHTLDIRTSPHLTYPGSDEYSYPIPDESYDVVLSANVIEHVGKPWKWLPELVRITRQNGLVITINPVSFPYHEVPVDCWRIYPDGMKALCEDASLTVILSLWESLEAPHFRRYIPGMSRDVQSRKRRIAYDILGWFGFPVERSYDAITVAKKISIETASSA